MSSIRLSERHGLNPSIGICYYCNKEDGTVVLPGKLKGGDPKAPHKAVWSMEPCKECKGWMKQGIILISTKDGESGNNPYRTGGWVVVTEESFARMFNMELPSKRAAFLEDGVWDAVGLPRSPVPSHQEPQEGP